MLSNTSSSSSPGKGDWKERRAKMKKMKTWQLLLTVNHWHSNMNQKPRPRTVTECLQRFCEINYGWLIPPNILRKHALTSPTSISKIRTPSPHQSTARVYDVSVKTSGAKNSGVPQNVLVRSLKPIPENNTEPVWWRTNTTLKQITVF